MSDGQQRHTERSDQVSTVLAVVAILSMVMAKMGEPVFAGGIAAVTLSLAAIFFAIPATEVRTLEP
jgi:hypothetical protein